MRRSVHRSITSGYVLKPLPQVNPWIGWRECAYCEAVIAPCEDCGDPWFGPCPYCLAPPELMLSIGMDGPRK